MADISVLRTFPYFLRCVHYNKVSSLNLYLLRFAIRAFEAAFQLVLPIPFAFGCLLNHHALGFLGHSTSQLITLSLAWTPALHPWSSYSLFRCTRKNQVTRVTTRKASDSPHSLKRSVLKTQQRASTPQKDYELRSSTQPKQSHPTLTRPNPPNLHPIPHGMDSYGF